MLAQRRHVIVSVLTVLLVVVACTGPTVTPAVDDVTIGDGERVVAAGSTLALTVTVETRGGASEAVLWSSDEPDTATVSSTGIVTGVSPGEARITATSALDASKADTITITVTPPPVTPGVLSVSIDAGERWVLVGETLPLTASVASVGGASEAVTWTSDDTGVATVSAAGVVTGVTVGEALITATSVFDPSESDSTPISAVLLPPGAPARISVSAGDSQTAEAGSAVPVPPTVRVRDTDDNPLQGVSVTFGVTAGGGAIAPSAPVTTNADGIAALSSWTLGTTAGSNGVRATVTGTEPPISVNFNATGVPGPASPQTSTVTANPTSLLADGSATSQLTIQLKDAYGNDLTTGGATVTFPTPSQGSVGPTTDNGNGTYTATYTAGTTAGTVTITPRVGGVNFTNTTSITLTAAVLSVTIDQANPTIIAGDTLQLTATVVTIGGASSALTWTSSNTSVATINPTTGLTTGVASGTTTITATSTHAPTESDSITLTVTPPPTGNPLWSRTFTSDGEEEATGLAVDADDNILLLFNTTSSSWRPAYGTGMVLAKLDRNGITQWHHQFGASTDDRGGGVTTDPQGNILVTGTTYGSLDGTNAGEADAFIAKFDPDGHLQWYRQLGTEAHDFGYAITIGRDGNILVAGVTGGALYEPVDSDEECFLAQYDLDGNRLWIKQYGVGLTEYPRSVAAGPTGDIVVAGFFHRGGYLWGFDAAGNQTWTADQGVNTTIPDIAFDMDGHLFVAGSRLETDPTRPYTAYLARYDQTGRLERSQSLGPAEGSFGRGVASDQHGNVLVTGTTNGSLGGSDPSAPAFLGKYDPDGNRIWVQQFHPDARYVAVDNHGNSLVAGTSNGSVNLAKFAP